MRDKFSVRRRTGMNKRPGCPGRFEVASLGGSSVYHKVPVYRKLTPFLRVQEGKRQGREQESKSEAGSDPAQELVKTLPLPEELLGAAGDGAREAGAPTGHQQNRNNKTDREDDMKNG